MGHRLVGAPTNRFSREYYELFDEFNYYTDADLWTELNTANGTVAHAGTGSLLKLFSTTVNDEAAVVTTNENFLFTANRSLYCEGLVEYTETSGNTAGILFGFADALGAGELADTTHALTINDSGAVIFKSTGGTVWKFQTEIGGTAVTSTSTSTAGGTAPQQLSIDIIPTTSTTFEARPFLNGAQLIDSTSNDPISHTITLGTATEMDFGLFAKGGHADDLNVYCDYLYAAASRVELTS